MQDVLAHLTVLLIGGALAGFYFGGLWWTVRRLPLAQRPWVLYFGSLLIRTVVVLGGLYVVLNQGGLPRMAVCLAGFIAARFVLVYRLGSHTSAVPSIDEATP